MQLALSSQKTELDPTPSALINTSLENSSTHDHYRVNLLKHGILSAPEYLARSRTLWKPIGNNRCVKSPLLSKNEKGLMSTCLKENMKDLDVLTAFN